MSNINMECDFTDIINGIEQMGKDVEQVKKKATLQGAKIIARKLKDNVNRSDIDKETYKHLEDNIKVSGLKEDGELNQYRGVGFGKLQYKANWLEFGTSKMQGQQVLTNTVQETKLDVKNAVNNALEEALNL